METLGIRPKQYKPIKVAATKYPSVEPLVTQAKELIATGKGIDESVVSILLDALEINPDDYEANYLAGTSLLALRKSEEAQGFLYKAVVVSNWTEHNGIANLAEALRLTGDFDLAMKVAQKGISQFDNTDPAGMLSFTLGSIFFNKQDYANAADWFLASAIKQKVNVALWLKASTLQFPSSSQEINFAKNVILQGIEANPTNADLYLYMGVAMQRDSKFEEAVTFYAEALHLNPSNFDAVVNMATSLHSLGRYDEAMQYYETAYANSPDNVMLVSNYASMLSVLGRYEQAFNILKTVMGANPDDATLFNTFKAVSDAAAASTPPTAIEHVQGSDERTLTVQAAIKDAVKVSDFDRVVQLALDYGEPRDGSSAWWYFAVGMSMIMKGEHNNGYDLCQRAELAAPTSHLVQGCLGVGAKGLQEYTRASKHFEKAYASVVDNSAEKNPPFPSLGFYASMEDMQMGLLSTLHDSGNSERCLEWYSYFAKIPSVGQGGSLLISLTQMQWTQEMIDQLDVVEKHSRENGVLDALPVEAKLLTVIEYLVGNYAHLSKQASDCLRDSNSLPIAKTRDFNKNVIDYLNQHGKKAESETVPI